MNLTVDAGNTFIKSGLFEGLLLKEQRTFNSPDEFSSFFKNLIVDHIIISSVSKDANSIIDAVKTNGKKMFLTPDLSLPIINRYSTPKTLGVDRIAAACGAWNLFPNQSSLVIDMGTCINYEIVSEKGEYLGGIISPGVKMRFQAMHDQTAKLPLANPTENSALTGDSTVSCLQSGVMNGVLEEIKGIIARYVAEYPGVRVILCGGDAHFFENHLNPSIFVAPELVLMGLNSILLHNVNS